VIGGTGAMLAGVTISNTSCTSEHKYNTTIDTSFLEAPLKTTAVLSTTDNQKSINDVSYSYEGPENYIEIKNNIIELHQFSTPQTNISYKILTIIDSKTVCETPLTVCPTNQQIVSNSGDTLSQNNLTITLTSFVNEEQLASS
jgi:hypothetical protein